MNEVNLIGNVGAIIFDNKEDEKKRCLIFSLATSEKYNDRAGNEVVNTQWHKITVFGLLACVSAKSIVVGSHLYVNGKLRYSTYNAEDGSTKTNTDIIANKVIISSK